MTDTIMLEAPARGGRISDLADGQGRILRLHDLTASSLGHTSHANQTESPTRTGGRVTIERKPDEGDGPAVIHRLNDERDQRWQKPLENILTTIFTPDIVSGTRGNNEGNRRGKH